jgi:uncharacterized membrane protein YeiH
LRGVATTTDALGLGAFAVVGTKLAAAAGLSAPAAVLVGVVNAVGGGILRSVLLNEVSEIFRPGELTALVALAGCLLYVLLTRVFTVDDKAAAAMTVFFVAAIRILSVRYRFATKPALNFAGVSRDSP